MLVLGIDCGLSRKNPTGAALVDTDAMQLVWYSCYTPPAVNWVERVGQVYWWLIGVYNAFQAPPKLIAYEVSHLEENPRVAIQLAHVGGAVVAFAAAFHLPVVQVQPSQAKLALAKDARATKQDMRDWCRLVFGEHPPKDAADAVGVALAAEVIQRQARLVATAATAGK